MAKLTKADRGLLSVIVAAMATETAFHMATDAEIANLVGNDMVEVNREIVDGDKFAVRATEKGVAEAAPVNEGNTTLTDNAAAAVAATAASFALIDGAVLPSGRAPRENSIYPFDTMNPGQSFFIPATEDKPNPAKSMASTVSSANKRFSTETGATKSVTVNVYQTDAAGKRVKGADGKLVKTGTETKTVPVLAPGKTFTVKPVKAGVTYGAFVAPADGALVARTA